MKTLRNEFLGLDDVVAARTRLDGAIARTPCPASAVLSEMTGSQIYCKQEFLQATGSFKERGARNALAVLLEEQVSVPGVVCASAGNHGLGVAWHGLELGVPVTVVMPESAPDVKVSRCRSLRAEVILHGNTFDEARDHAATVATKRGYALIHPFDDLAVIAGQGTVALEILEQVPDVEAVVVPVGGGGLLAGICTVLRTLRPEVAVIGVEPEHAASFSTALQAGRPIPAPTRATLADGLAVAQVGKRSFGVAAPLVNRVVTVDEGTLARAIRCLAAVESAAVEGAGAAALAALMDQGVPELVGRRVVLLLTGGNIDAATFLSVQNGTHTAAVRSSFNRSTAPDLTSVNRNHGDPR